MVWQLARFVLGSFFFIIHMYKFVTLQCTVRSLARSCIPTLRCFHIKNRFPHHIKLNHLNRFFLFSWYEALINALILLFLQKMLHSTNKEYDVMFLELVLMYECFMPLAEKLAVPVIGTMTLRSGRMPDWAIGNPYNPAVLPAEFSDFSDRMTFLQRVKSTLHHLAIQFCYWFMVIPQLNKIYKEFYSSNLLYRKKVSVVFYNNHPTYLSRPLVPNAFDIGGIHMKTAKPLPQVLSQFNTSRLGPWFHFSWEGFWVLNITPLFLEGKMSLNYSNLPYNFSKTFKTFIQVLAWVFPNLYRHPLLWNYIKIFQYWKFTLEFLHKWARQEGPDLIVKVEEHNHSDYKLLLVLLLHHEKWPIVIWVSKRKVQKDIHHSWVPC